MEAHRKHTCVLYAQQTWQHVQAKSKRTTGLPKWAQALIPGPVTCGNVKGSASQHKTRAPSVACKA